MIDLLDLKKKIYRSKFAEFILLPDEQRDIVIKNIHQYIDEYNKDYNLPNDITHRIKIISYHVISQIVNKQKDINTDDLCNMCKYVIHSIFILLNASQFSE